MLALSLLLLTLPAGPAPEAPAGGPMAAEADQDPGAEGAQEMAQTSGELSGRWAVIQVLSNRSEVPFVGDAVANTRIVMLFDLVEEQVHGQPTQLAGDGEVCLLDIKARPTIVRPVLPESFRRTVRKQRFEAHVERQGSVTRLRGARQGGVLGAKLDQPWKDPMPAPDSSRIVDTDGDGKPGMTMRVEGLFDIEFYLAQRQWTQLTGTQVADGHFRGPLRHSSEQVLLGADHFILQALPDMKPDPRESRFEMVRLDPAATCDAAVIELLPDTARERGLVRSTLTRRQADTLSVQPAAAH